MASSTVENYIKEIYSLQFDKGAGGTVAMGDLAGGLGVTPGTATSMVKGLDKTGLVSYIPRVGVELTEQGQQLALLVLRRHRLIELFLVQVLGMEWHEIHDEAEALERIDELLGNPVWDPHGDPIPSPTGEMKVRKLVSLDHCEAGQLVCIGRIEDQEEAFLQYLDSNSLRPGQELEVKSIDVHAGVIGVAFPDEGTCSLGFPAAGKILVELHS